MILHHYEMSPFSEKMRAMFGYANLAWQSAISPPMPPRPTIDPLSGGYRRIPIAQIGADVFCDTQIISAEVAQLAGIAGLNPETISSKETEFIDHVDHKVFMAMAASPAPAKILRLLFTNMAPWTAARFVLDRAKMTRSMSNKPISRRKSQDLLREFFESIEGRLNKSPYLFGEQPSLADFSAYHVVWFGGMINSLSFLDALPAAQDWYRRIQEFGHGQRSEFSRKKVFNEAANAEPRPLSQQASQMGSVHPLLEKEVSIGPDDYAQDRVAGRLIFASSHRVILRRETEKFGALHIHFPSDGYLLKAVGEP